MDAFEAELKGFFLQEAQQLIQEGEQLLMSLEGSSGNGATLDAMFRIAHNIKGSSRGVGFTAIGDFTHVFESALLKIKEGNVALTSPTISLLLACNDFLKMSFEKLTVDLTAEMTDPALVARLQNLIDNGAESLDADAVPSHDDAGFSAQPESPVASAPSAPALHVVQPQKAAPPKTDEHIRVGLQRVDELINDVGEIVILQTVLTQNRHLIDSALLQNTIMQLNKITKSIQDKATSLRMVSMKGTFQKMQRIVRDTSAALEKEIQFKMVGEDSEIDKTVADQISDPLVHLIRNACDHGLESTEDREAKGKLRAGTIQLSAYQKGGSMVIEVSDDGKGLNVDVIRAKAIEKKIITANQNLSDSEIHNLIFHAGFSTKAQVTDLSGRGVGLDVVRTNVEALKGTIQIETALGKGTTFRIILPLTLAIIDGMVLRINNDERYVLPTSQVVEVVQPNSADVGRISGKDDVLLLRGETLPLFRLQSMLSRDKSKKDDTNSVAIIGRSGMKRFALLTDEILGKQQIVIKQLGNDIGRIRGIAGGAILGDGRAALILDMNELVQAR
jgi:two-component system, chemotaxis family, sensor kinase CheA